MPVKQYTQANRRIAVTTPLKDDVLLLRSITGSEGISQLFQFHLELLSEDDSLDFEQLVGKKISTRIFLADKSERKWHGFVSRFSQGGRDANLTSYHAEMVPWLWFLTRTSDCRIFQSQTVPEIIKKIFSDLKFQDFELKLYKSYRKRDYCVQYRETDFHFVSRLMEEEGIFYFFDHSKGSDHLVLADDPAAHSPCPCQPKVRYELSAGGWQDDDVILEWEKVQEFCPGSCAHTDYNFEQPSNNLMVTVSGSNPYEVYDYPGEYQSRSDGDSLLKVRLEQETLPGVVIRGVSDCRAFASGSTTELEEHYRSDMNGKYVLTSIKHRATQGGDFGSGINDPETSYRNQFECIPASVPFRPPRVTTRPTVRGCQTAMIVGPGGEEIYTDTHGRVKVQFHWDREGKRDEHSSCWVRVSHPWAGKGWGSLSIPRIGQEVVIDFLEGDPDQPIIIGRVYNGESAPPFGMPGGAMISGIKSNSTKGGGGYNEISLNDTKGTELINIHAQYDQQKKVEHDERVDVGNDRTEHVGRDEKIMIDHDRTEEVKHDEGIKIGNDKRELVIRDRQLEVDRDKLEKVLRDKSIHVVRNHDERIDGSMDIMVGSTLTESVAINYSETVGGAMEITVGGLIAISAGAALAEIVGLQRSEAVGGSSSESVGGSKSLDITGNLTETVASDRIVDITKDLKEKVGGQHTESVTKEFALKAKKIQLVADDEINIKTGSAQIVMKKNGDITIQGAKLNIKGSGDIIMKGSKIKEN